MSDAESRSDRAAPIPLTMLLPPRAETEHFTWVATAGYLPVTLDEWSARAEQVLDDVAARLGLSLDERIGLRFERPRAGACPARGYTVDLQGPEIAIVADERTSSDQLLAVLAHEIAHALHFSGFDSEPANGVGMLYEGLATWAAGQYWLDWHGVPSFQSAVLTYLDSGAYLPLHENEGGTPTAGPEGEAAYGKDCVSRRDILYIEWAAFIEHLLDRFGRDRLFELLRVSSTARTEARDIGIDYSAVYGRSLNELEMAWLQEIRAEF